MNTLLEKISKQRSIVEENGLHIEHKVLPPPQLSQHDRSNFLAAMERRRAMVDHDAETFENKPTAQVADCVHEATALRNSDTGRLSAVCNGVDPKVCIDQQQAETADCGHNIAQVNSSDQEPVILPDAQQHAAHAQAPAAVQLPTEPEATADKLEVSREERVEPTAAAAGAGCMEVGNREEEVIKNEEELVKDEEEEADHESIEHEEETAETANDEEARDAAAQGAGVNGIVTHSGNRISWLVGLCKSSATATFESSCFEVGGYGPMTLRLRPSGNGCLLSLHGDPPRSPGIRVGLFASKGWRRTAIKPWSGDADVEARFDVDLRGRASILCGLIYKMDRQ